AGSLALPEGPEPTVTLAVVPGAVVDVEAEGRAAAVLELVGADGTVLGAQELSLDEATTTTLTAQDLTEEVDGEVAGLVLRTEDPRVVWGAVLTVEEDAGDMVSVLVPVAPEPARPEVGVRLR
ncbi:hypothetical protein, partial [Actinotalea sp. C106]|uniref:hypothetical protein n=1 Tax=Actinotalea sp. C106 TaxID=2908644 RepID=UPI0020283D6E